MAVVAFCCGFGHDCFVKVGIEGIAGFAQTGKAKRHQGVEEQRVDGRNVGGALSESSVARIEHRQEPLDGSGRGEGCKLLLPLLGLFPEVGELGRDPLVLISFGGYPLEVGDEGFDGELWNWLARSTSCIRLSRVRCAGSSIGGHLCCWIGDRFS